MANKEVNIFFKVEGLDGYITDLSDLKNALEDVDSATQGASMSQEELEQKLSTLEGGVKVLAGSFEAAAGALGALGIESEFFQAVEENVINIIAMAEGAINVSEGFKLLAENQKLATIAQRAFNIASNANPYVILASALVAAGGALLIWKMNAEDAVPPTEDLANEVERLSDEKNATNIDKIIDRIDALRKAAFGDDTSEVDNAIDLVAEVTAAIEASAERENQLLREASEVEDETFQERLRNSQIYTDERLAQEIERNQKILDDEETNEDTRLFLQKVQDALRTRQAVRAEQDLQFQLTAELESAVAARDKIIEDSNANTEYFTVEQVKRINYELDAVNAMADAWRQYYKLRNDESIKVLQTPTTLNLPDEEIDSFADSYFKAFNAIVEEPQMAAELLKRDFSAAIDFVGNLSTVFTKDNEKRAKRQFNLNKALGISTAIINTAEGITTALTDKTQPSTILRIAQAAAVAASGAAQIATIKRQQFSVNGGTESPSVSTPSAGATINYSFDQNSGQEITAGNQGNTNVVQPLQAYVLVSDVNNAQQASQQIQNLSRL